jgi:hypothetical protein
MNENGWEGRDELQIGLEYKQGNYEIRRGRTLYESGSERYKRSLALFKSKLLTQQNICIRYN